MTTAELDALRTELRTQDNACTAEPIFLVYDKQRIYGLDSDYAEHYCWLYPDRGDGRSEVTDSQMVARLNHLESLGKDPEIAGVEYARIGYVDVDRFITCCLTRKAAKRFIAANSHRLRKPFVYVESLDRNDELIALRNHLMGVNP
jgi:hypothetical protein